MPTARTVKPRRRLEREIAADIRQWMQLHGYLAIRCVAGPVRSMRIGQETPEQTNPEGFPDWCFLKVDSHGCDDWTDVFFIETKRPGEKPTKIQQAWLESLRIEAFRAEWFDGFREPEGVRPFLTWWEENFGEVEWRE